MLEKAYTHTGKHFCNIINWKTKQNLFLSFNSQSYRNWTQISVEKLEKSSLFVCLYVEYEDFVLAREIYLEVNRIPFLQCAEQNIQRGLPFSIYSLRTTHK
jgi:hypothetical protein